MNNQIASPLSSVKLPQETAFETKKNIPVSAPPIFTEASTRISEKVLRKLLYIDLLHQSLPWSALKANASSHPVNPLSPYFLDRTSTKVRHASLLERLLQSTSNPRVILRPAEQFQAIAPLEKIWNFAHSITEGEHPTLFPELIQRAHEIIKEGNRLNTEYTKNFQALAKWTEDVITLATSYYAYCLQVTKI